MEDCNSNLPGDSGFEKVTREGTEGSLQPTVSKELKPTASEELSAANNHMNATSMLQ